MIRTYLFRILINWLLELIYNIWVIFREIIEYKYEIWISLIDISLWIEEMNILKLFFLRLWLSWMSIRVFDQD